MSLYLPQYMTIIDSVNFYFYEFISKKNPLKSSTLDSI